MLRAKCQSAVAFVLVCLLNAVCPAAEPGRDEFQTEQDGMLYYRPGLYPADRPVRPPEEKPAKPFSFSIDYTVVSDYVIRGINCSEYAGEGREKPNHQLGVGLSLDTSEIDWNIGTFGFTLLGDWYTGQKQLTPASSGTLQELDYIVFWVYDIPRIYTTVEAGWVALTFPQSATDAYYTNEWYVKLYFDDSVLFGTEQSLLNPFISYNMDTDDADGSWLAWGLSHDFALSNMGLADAPILKDITVTPSFMMGLDNGQLGPSMRVAHLQYGLNVCYDLSGALNVPQEYGTISITGFVYFSDAIFAEAINDEFWGGVTFAYAW